MPFRIQTLLACIITLLAVSQIFLWWQQRKILTTLDLLATVSPLPSDESMTSPVLNSNSQPASLDTNTTDLSDLEASLAAVINRLTTLEQAPPSTTQKITASPPGTANSFQKQILYLGAATTIDRDWHKTGIQVTVNTLDYPSTVNAAFEAGLSIVSGEVNARLVNKTTGAIITLSEVSHNTSTITWKKSGHFKLHAGTNVYEVELRSSSGEEANLAGARLIIE